LRETPGVTVDLAAVDCLDVSGTTKLFANLTHPVSGVFYIPVRLNDQLFTNLKTEEDWKMGEYYVFDILEPFLNFILVYDVKVKGLEVLLEVIDPKSLDFLVLASSMATVSGSPGQLPTAYHAFSQYSLIMYEKVKLTTQLPRLKWRLLGQPFQIRCQ
jgi:fatty acid synthase